MSDSAARQRAVGGQRPEREIGRIAVILQVEHARKSRRREAGVGPRPIPLLGTDEELSPALRSLRSRLACCEQPEKCPGGLIGGAGEALRLARRLRIGIVALAPATI